MPAACCSRTGPGPFRRPASWPSGPSGRPWTRRRRSGLRALAVSTAVGVAVGLAGFVVSQPAEAGTVGAGSYADTLPAGGPLPSGCGSISTNPRAVRHRQRPGRRRAHQRLVVLAAVQEVRLRVQRAAARAPALVRHLRQRARVLLQHHRRRSAAPRPAWASTTTRYAAGLPRRRRRAERARRQGRRLDRLDRHARTGATAARTHEGHHRPRPAVRATSRSPAATRSSPPPARPTVWSNSGATIGFTVNGHDYVAYAPTGSTWTVSGTTITSTLAGKGFFSVAVLPTTPQQRPTRDRAGRHLRPVRARPRHRHQGLATATTRRPARSTRPTRSPPPPGRAAAPARSSRSTRTSGTPSPAPRRSRRPTSRRAGR